HAGRDTMITTILLAHTCPVLRLGIRRALEQMTAEIVGDTSEEELVVEAAALLKPTVVLLDESLSPDLLAVLDRLRRAGAQGIVVFAAVIEEETLFRWMLCGVAAVVS